MQLLTVLSFSGNILDIFLNNRLMPPKYDFYDDPNSEISFSRGASADGFPVKLLLPIQEAIKSVDVDAVTNIGRPWFLTWDKLRSSGFTADELYLAKLFPHQLFLKQFEAQFADIANKINSNEPKLVAEAFYDYFFSPEDLRSCGRTVIRDQIRQACIQWLAANFDTSNVFGEV